MEASKDEAELIRAALRRDEAAWEALVRIHQEPVFRYAYLIQGDSDEAEDTAQETFIHAYRALERFDISRPLRPWLLSITANLARNRFRSLGRYVSALRRMILDSPGHICECREFEYRTNRCTMAVAGPPKNGRD